MKKIIPLVLLLTSCATPSQIQPSQTQVEQPQSVTESKPKAFSVKTTKDNLQQSFKDTLNSTQKQLEQGIASQQQAEKQFKQIRDDARANLETQKLAQKFIIDSKQTEIDKQSTLSENRIEGIKQLFYEEKISDSEKERRINLETTQGLAFKLKVTKDMIKEEEDFKTKSKSQ